MFNSSSPKTTQSYFLHLFHFAYPCETNYRKIAFDMFAMDLRENTGSLELQQGPAKKRCHSLTTGPSPADVARLPPPLIPPPPPPPASHLPPALESEEIAMAASTASRLSPPRFHVPRRSPPPPLRRTRFSPVRAAKYAPFLDPFFSLPLLPEAMIIHRKL